MTPAPSDKPSATAGGGVAPGVRIGAHIRQSRQQRGMTILELADASGLTKGHLSQVERDLTSVSVASLVRICEALDISVGSLFDKPARNFVPKADRPRINFGGEDVEEFLLTPSTETRFQVIEQIVKPGGGGGDEQYSLRAEAEFVHVLRGRLEVRIGDEVVEVAAGDSLTFSAREEHTWRNASNSREAHAIWVFSPALT
jgi:transcriptional regulator with XRE-family HTH domain